MTILAFVPSLLSTLSIRGCLELLFATSVATTDAILLLTMDTVIGLGVTLLIFVVSVRSPSVSTLIDIGIAFFFLRYHSAYA